MFFLLSIFPIFPKSDSCWEPGRPEFVFRLGIVTYTGVETRLDWALARQRLPFRANVGQV